MKGCARAADAPASGGQQPSSTGNPNLRCPPNPSWLQARAQSLGPFGAHSGEREVDERELGRWLNSVAPRVPVAPHVAHLHFSWHARRPESLDRTQHLKPLCISKRSPSTPNSRGRPSTTATETHLALQQHRPAPSGCIATQPAHHHRVGY